MKAKVTATKATATVEKPTIPQRLMTAKEAALYLGFPTAWPVRALAWKGELPTVHLSERRIAFDVADLDRFIETHKTRELTR